MLTLFRMHWEGLLEARAGQRTQSATRPSRAEYQRMYDRLEQVSLAHTGRAAQEQETGSTRLLHGKGGSYRERLRGLHRGNEAGQTLGGTVAA